MKTLYVSDMDGTLLQPDARLSERTVSMLNEAIASGKLFTVATARTPATVASLMQRVSMNIPAIVMTGAALWNPADGRYSRLRLMEPEAARSLLEVYRTQNCPSFIYSLRDNMITIATPVLCPNCSGSLSRNVSTPRTSVLSWTPTDIRTSPTFWMT